jgi:hypothetical protein
MIPGVIDTNDCTQSWIFIDSMTLVTRTLVIFNQLLYTGDKTVGKISVSLHLVINLLEKNIL